MLHTQAYANCLHIFDPAYVANVCMMDLSLFDLIAMLAQTYLS